MPNTSLADISILDLLPPSLSGDESVRAVAVALDAEMQDLAADTSGAAILPNLPNVPERVLDILAEQLLIDNYSQSYTVEQKQALIAAAVLIQRRKGTPDAVQQVVSAIFGPGFTVQEWHQYGGAPYHFRIIGPSGFTNPAQQAALTLAVHGTKRCSAVLDGISVSTTEETAVYVGCYLQIFRSGTLEAS